MKHLFQERMHQSWRKRIPLIAAVIRGGGTPIFLGILLFTLYFSYQNFLQWLPTDFPSVYPFAFLLSLLLLQTQMRTWIQQADLIFLLPGEQKMRGYFQASFLYSYGVSLIKWGILFFIFYPFYVLHIENKLSFFGFVLVIMLLQLANLYLKWHIAKQTMIVSTPLLFIYYGGSFLLNFLWICTYVQGRWTTFILAMLILLGWIYYFQSITKSLPYPWVQLEKQEQRRKAYHYSIIRWFMDVPERKIRVKKRRWIIQGLKVIFPNPNPYFYLYQRSFTRTEDQWPTFPRIHIWVLFIVLGFPNIWLASSLLLISLYIMSQQLSTLADERRYPLWIQIYPLTRSESVQSLSLITMILLSLQSIFLTLIFFIFSIISLSTALLLLLIAITVSYYLSYLYLPHLLAKPSTHR